MYAIVHKNNRTGYLRTDNEWQVDRFVGRNTRKFATREEAEAYLKSQFPLELYVKIVDA